MPLFNKTKLLTKAHDFMLENTNLELKIKTRFKYHVQFHQVSIKIVIWNFSSNIFAGDKANYIWSL